MEDYPKTLAELEMRFVDDSACRAYLYALRWPDGFNCPKCSGIRVSPIANGLYLCLDCHHKTSVIQGTIFQDSHLPLRTWFRAMWYVCVQKNGASTLGLQRALGLGSYRTSWLMLHKLRKAMLRPGRDKLSGEIEFDETYVGGVRHGRRGRGAAGKSIVVVAAEKRGKGIGRIRMMCVPSFSADDLHCAMTSMVEDGATIITDGLRAYNFIPKHGYTRVIEHESEDIDECRLSRCHLVASLMKRWILGTLQGSVSHEHLQDYLNEFTFRFNRRKSQSRGKLFYRLTQYSVETEAFPYVRITKHNL